MMNPNRKLLPNPQFPDPYSRALALANLWQANLRPKNDTVQIQDARHRAIVKSLKARNRWY